MKTKTVFLGILAFFVFFACDDTLTQVGMGIQPDKDKVSLYDTTLYVTTSTVKIDSIYAKSIVGYLGEIYDPSYGTIKSSFACEFYPSYGFDLDSIIGTEIDSARLFLFFNTYLGDSLAPMELTVFPVKESLDKSYYSNINPADFCDMNNPIAKHGYMARNPYVSDSLVNEGYYRAVSIPLPKEFGQKFLDEYKKPEPNAFSSVEAFTEYFPGTYITNTFGVGSMIASELTRIHIYYKRNYTLESSEGTDSIAVGIDYADFRVTKEVVQINSFESKGDDYLLAENEDSTFIKSPVGVYTKITIPIKEITEGVGTRKFSGVSLSLKAYPKNSWEYGFNYPGLGTISSTSMIKSKLLLIEPDSVKNFFETQSVADSKTSYTTTMSNYEYSFSNIANVVQNAIENAPDKDLELLLIPVQTSYTQQSSSYYSSYYYDVDYSTTHYLYPSAVALRKNPENLKIRVIATDLEVNE